MTRGRWDYVWWVATAAAVWVAAPALSAALRHPVLGALGPSSEAVAVALASPASEGVAGGKAPGGNPRATEPLAPPATQSSGEVGRSSGASRALADSGGVSSQVTPTPAGALAVRARLEPTQPKVGDRIHFVVEVEHPAEVTVLLPGRQLKSAGLEVLDYREESLRLLGEETGGAARAISRALYELTCFQTGDYQLSGLEVVVRWGEGAPQVVPVEPVNLSVVSVLESWPAEPADIAGPVPAPSGRLSWMGVALLAAALLALGLVVHLIRRGRRRQRAQPPPLPPHILARNRLTELERRLEQSTALEFYESIADILRNFLQETEKPRARFLTTEETRRALQESDADPRTVEGAYSVLSAADLVKFGRAGAALGERREALREVEQIVARYVERREAALAKAALGAQKTPDVEGTTSRDAPLSREGKR